MTSIRRTVVALVLAAGGAAGVGTAQAVPTVTDLQCALEDTIQQSYGLTLAPSASEFRSTGHGAITCTGVYEGEEVEGTGPVEMVGRTGDTWCGAGPGTADFSGWVPRKDGPGKVRISGSQAWTRTGLVLTTRATSGAPVSGLMYAQPLNGDCKDTPVTVVRLRAPLLVTTG